MHVESSRANWSVNTLVDKMDTVELTGAPIGQHTIFKVAGILDVPTFTLGLLSTLNSIPEPDFPQFGIVGFGLVARVIADSPNFLRVDLQLTSAECSKREGIRMQAVHSLREFLKGSSNEKFNCDPVVTILSPADPVRGRPWGPYYQDAVVSEQFTVMSEDFPILVAAGYLTKGQCPDQLFHAGLELFKAWRGDADVLEALEGATSAICDRYGLTPIFEKINIAQVRDRNIHFLASLS